MTWGRPGPVRRTLRSAAAALKVLNHSRFNNRHDHTNRTSQKTNSDLTPNLEAL